MAKNVVAAGLAERCEVQVAYAIGEPEPVAIAVDTFATSRREDAELEQWIRENFDLTPRGIIDSLELLRPIYSVTSAYGHFGRPAEPSGAFSWEVVRGGAVGGSGVHGTAG